MSAYRITSEDRLGYGDAILFLLDFSRLSSDNFTFGPFNGTLLMTSGLSVTGDADKAIAALQKALPKLAVTNASAS